MRTQLAALSFIALLGFAAAPGLALSASGESAADGVPYSVESAPRECCKICKKGKACGDSCIARDKKCHKPPGCACDG